LRFYLWYLYARNGPCLPVKIWHLLDLATLDAKFVSF
jgi:hypothetical protein